MRSPMTLARVGGTLYLLVCVLGAVAHLGVRADVYVPGDAAATTSNLVANADAFRFALVADIGMATIFALLGVVLYRLLSDVDRGAATMMLVFVAAGAAMILTNLGFHHAALMVATDTGFVGGLGPAGSEATTLLLLQMHHDGYRIAGIFFGLWLLPLGYLIVRSSALPRLLGIALLVAGVSWIVDTLVGFAVPDLPDGVHAVLTAPTVAEFGLLYLLVRGVRQPRPAVVEG